MDRAILGVSAKLLVGASGVPSLLSNVFYLLMGWIGAIGAGPISRCLPRFCLFWLCAGGLSYSGGMLWLIFVIFPAFLPSS
jgi:channel protein (hemolysin III family)